MPALLRCRIFPVGTGTVPVLEKYARRISWLQLVEDDSQAELLLLESPHPQIAAVFLGRCDLQQEFDSLAALPRSFDFPVFARLLDKVRTRLRTPETEQPASEASFFLKSDYRIVRIDAERILYIEGMKNYAKIHLQGEPKPVLSLISLKALLDKLPPERFVRTHRSYIVNLNHLQEIVKGHALVGKARIPIADRHKATLAARIRLPEKMPLRPVLALSEL